MNFGEFDDFKKNFKAGTIQEAKDAPFALNEKRTIYMDFWDTDDAMEFKHEMEARYGVNHEKPGIPKGTTESGNAVFIEG